MSLSREQRIELVKYRLKESNEAEKDVELLLENGRLRAALNRVYYSMFYSLMALGINFEFETSKHAQLIGWFNKTFVKAQLVDLELGRIISKAYNLRTNGDYDSYFEIEAELILEMVAEMKSLNQGVK